MKIESRDEAGEKSEELMTRNKWKPDTVLVGVFECHFLINKGMTGIV